MIGRARLLRLIFKPNRLLFIPVILWQLLFTLAPYIPTESRPDIDESSLVRMEALLFGILPHQKLPQLLGNIVLDVICAIPYTIHFILPFATLAFMFMKDRSRIWSFAFAFGMLNLTAVLTQIVFPTAPPWYYEAHVNADANYFMPGDSARLANVDRLFGTSFYSNLYGTSPVVFGSFPSLHAAWPFMIAIFKPSPTKLMYVYSFWVWFAAVYLWHHFFVDILGGIIYAVFCVWLSNKIKS
eukprot:gb/GECH01006252.1/.p1 GENE.gb/GECH01006252.1/~~gb/GECH01006252.1/.p1  ORF type:complete len:241 (+),score=36.25 gb/GECH01006252.1/:1-723(+)